MRSDEITIVWSPESEEDLLNIWHWGAIRFSPDIADSHLRDIGSVVANLRQSPFMGQARDDLMVGIRRIVVYPTIVFYRVAADRVEIVRVVDGRRDFAALFSGQKS